MTPSLPSWQIHALGSVVKGMMKPVLEHPVNLADRSTVPGLSAQPGVVALRYATLGQWIVAEDQSVSGEPDG